MTLSTQSRHHSRLWVGCTPSRRAAIGQQHSFNIGFLAENRDASPTTPLRPKMPSNHACRSELARDELDNTKGCQDSSVIVDDHREQARSYSDPLVDSIHRMVDLAGIRPTIIKD